MAVYVFVVCMYVSVWCGWAPLSLSLWILAGMVVGWHDSRAGGVAIVRLSAHKGSMGPMHRGQHRSGQVRNP